MTESELDSARIDELAARYRRAERGYRLAAWRKMQAEVNRQLALTAAESDLRMLTRMSA